MISAAIGPTNLERNIAGWNQGDLPTIAMESIHQMYYLEITTIDGNKQKILERVLANIIIVSVTWFHIYLPCYDAY